MALAAVYSCIPEGINTEPPPEAYYAAPRPMEKVIAVYDYEAQGDQELNLEEGTHHPDRRRWLGEGFLRLVPRLV